MKNSTFTIADAIKSMFAKSYERRMKRLEAMNAPAEMIPSLQKKIDDIKNGKYKLPGEIRGYFAPYFSQPFTEGFIFDNTLYFKHSTEGVEEGNCYIQVSEGRYGTDFRKVFQVPVDAKPLTF